MEDVRDHGSKEYGKTIIADEVVEIIAGIATTEIHGVTAMSGGIAGGIAEKLGKTNLSKGVKVEVGEKEVVLDLSLIVEYGSKIPEVAWNIQENVKKEVENMTGLKVIEVNIHVQGINMEKEIEDIQNKKDPKK